MFNHTVLGLDFPKDGLMQLKKKRVMKYQSSTDAPRGSVIRKKIEKYFPGVSKIPASEYILKSLPSFGGDWKQYYDIRMEWKK